MEGVHETLGHRLKTPEDFVEVAAQGQASPHTWAPNPVRELALDDDLKVLGQDVHPGVEIDDGLGGSDGASNRHGARDG
jgi:hypothetical protein